MTMDKNPLKEKLQNNELSIGSWLQINHPEIAEIMAMMGFEWLTVDMEHSVITIDMAQNLIRTIESRGVVPLVRVGENNPNLVKRVMDAGAFGVIVPMVNSKRDAEKAVAAAKYPPEGMRGVGIARAQGYGMNVEEYLSWINDESIVIAQIEHIEGVKNLESIVTVEGIDGCIIGPYDLSGSMGIPGQYENPRVEKAMLQIERTCRENETPLGFHIVPPDYRLIPYYIEKGYTFLAFSSDMLFLERLCRDQVQKMKEVLHDR